MATPRTAPRTQTELPAAASRTWLREAALLGGFVLLVAIAAFTVVLPELADEPAQAEQASDETAPSSAIATP